MIIEPLWSDVEAADFLQIHPKTLQRMARRAEIPAYRLGRYWRFRGSELDAWLRSQARSSNPSASATRKERFQ
jgi:excisionase family DNA binding protein